MKPTKGKQLQAIKKLNHILADLETWQHHFNDVADQAKTEYEVEHAKDILIRVNLKLEDVLDEVTP